MLSKILKITKNISILYVDNLIQLIVILMQI